MDDKEKEHKWPTTRIRREDKDEIKKFAEKHDLTYIEVIHQMTVALKEGKI